MKRNKKLVALICTVLLLVGAAGATLAWLADKAGPVENTFTVGNIDIELYETEDGEEVSAREYKMVPGDILDKDPTVKVVAKSEPCYLFVKIEKENGFDDFMSYGMATGWTPGTKTADNEGNGVPVGVFFREVAMSDSDQTFGILADDQVRVLDTVTKKMMDGVEKNKLPKLTFNAYAVQKAHVATPADAWTQAMTDANYQ